jgi:uncharacterized glyoxalase superfamily protein PhnB
MSETTARTTFGSAIIYKDPAAALDWLEKAFGFDTTMRITDETGKLVHSEMEFGNGYIMVGDEWAENMKAPGSIGGANTQRLSVHIDSDVDAHCERARSAGARISMEPADQPYGARDYLAIDPEGHEWDFSQPKQAAPGEMERSGMKVERFGDEPAIGTFFPQAFYVDAKGAVEWLTRAFGFETAMLIESDAGLRAHLSFQGGEVAIGSEYIWEGHPPRRSPRSTGAANTQTVHVQLTSDIDAHCVRARAAGAQIAQEPETQFYGDRTYRAIDAEGHMWTFGQTVQVMTPEEWDAASGLKTQTSR